MLSILAFLPFAAKPAAVMAPPSNSVFAPRWWFRLGRLDPRPVIWSLETAPNDWIVESVGRCIVHRKSGHRMSTRWWLGYVMHSDYCGCSQRRWQSFYKAALGNAINRRLRIHSAEQRAVDQRDSAMFASHFLPRI